MRLWRGVIRPSHVALALLTVLTGVLIVLAVQRQYGPQPAADPSPVARPQMSVGFIGDSFTSGSRDGGVGPANYTALLASREGWTELGP